MDRNQQLVDTSKDIIKTSLSARRAWIEMLSAEPIQPCAGVALRKESVDRNSVAAPHHPQRSTSLSARRAWIEMSSICPTRLRPTVALRKESVDRNKKMFDQIMQGDRRSPQGERG